MTVQCFLLATFLIAFSSASPAGVYVGKNGEVGASWGGYSASAGLGGLVTGNGAKGGLHAEAGTPQHFAAAGLGGSTSGGGNAGGLYSAAGGHHPIPVSGGASSSASSSSSSSSGVVGPVGPKDPHRTVFDDIFNIPVSVLGAVNQYLNNKSGGEPRSAPRRGRFRHNKHTVVAIPVDRIDEAHSSSVSASAVHGHPPQVHPKPVYGTIAESDPVPPSASASAASSASASASSSAGNGPAIDNHIRPSRRKPNYDDIFNIPISVLGAVNKLLNG